ncbi:helix-turn-helix domain-containing protein [Bacillus mycoides]|uniref:Transcriptional regulator n=1 Tax=Bacillus cereus TaxID=1396 RepID=A0A1S9U5X9_BACCE|nr:MULTISPECIES: helix-turn-helix domain-containing protein [Bacillus cereus group]OOR17653.1 transcriptional regulator [Bacillus cereus]QWG33969.1 helix-turn-helix domain-containing protein [Bacillus mycoides]TBX81409.1 helix-turn-helix domain-containing protein [Bacillus mycoides]
MEIGERIRQVRMHKGLTQGELVSEICSTTYLSRIESGKIKPSSSFIKKVSKKLDVNSDYLIDGNYEEIKLTIFKICNRYKKDKSITEADVSLLELYVREVDSIPLLIKVYGVLIYYHARQKNILYVKSLVDQASQMIPSQVEMQDPEDYIYYLKARGFYFYNNQDYIAAHDIYVQAESLLGIEETEQHAHIYYNLCHVYREIYKDKSISRLYALKAYNIYSENGMQKNVINTLLMLAVLYIMDELYEKALETLQQVENSVATNGDSMYLPIISYDYGKINQGLKDYTNAIKYYEEALELSEFLSQKHQKVYVLRNMIEVYIELKDWKNVNKFMNEALHFLSVYDVPVAHVQLYGLKAKIFKIRGDYYEYEKNMQKAIDVGVEKKQHRLVAELSYELGNFYNENRSYKLSAKYFKISAENKMD